MKLQISLSSSMSSLHGVMYDQIKGKGAIPFNQDIGHKGIVVMMKPSVFLGLCFPIQKGHAETTGFDFLKDWIKEGNPIGSPWLRIELKRDEERNWISSGAYISGHEGRNRALAIKELYGEIDMPIHITFNTDGNKFMTPDIREGLRSGLKNEMGRFVVGPLWSM